MLLTLLATSLIVSSACANQTPLDVEFQEQFCSRTDQSLFPGFTTPQLVNEHQTCSHHEHAKNNATTSYDPWTREPQCIKDEDSKETFCVYTNERFANGRGISFFTTPAIAKRVEKLPAFIRSGIHDAANIFEDPPWEVKNIPGRGNGLFATRALHRGDQIVADTPVGVFQSDAFFPDYPNGYQYLHKAFDQLPKATQEIFLRTAMHSAGDPIMERINTNAFAGDFEGAPHFLMYPETALMNHDCRPNALYFHDPSTLIHATYASRTIQPGEEITITYINILQPRSERQNVLQNAWGFTCTCSLCSGDAKTVAASDARIAEVQSISRQLSDWSPTSPATPEMALQLIALYEEEEVHAAIGMGHMFAALAYNAIGDTSRAKKHARLAMEAGLVGSEQMEKDFEEMTALRASPREHWSYMARAKNT